MCRIPVVLATLFWSVAALTQPALAHDITFVYQVIEDMRHTPYECEAYDPATDSCASLSIMESQEGILYNTSWIAIPFAGGAPWVFKVVTEYTDQMGWACPLYGATQVYTEYVSGGVPSQGAVYAGQIGTQLAEAQSYEDPCAGYYAYGPNYPGQYRVEFRTPYGDVAPQGPADVRFFREPKALRP